MEPGQRAGQEARRDRILRALEELMRIVPGSLPQAMGHAAQCISQLTTSEQRSDGAHARVSVTGEGPGISPDMRHRLFERFARGPGSKGLGLGLFLVRSIAEAHGGWLTVESEPGQGASFSLTLPLEAEEADAR